MKLTFEKNLLENAVNDSLCAVSDKNTYQTLECIRFRTEEGSGTCSLTTFDLNKGFTTELPCDVERPGNYLINAQKLNRIIKFLPDRYVTIEVGEKNLVTLSSGRSKFELHALDGETFPNIPELDGEKGFSVDAGILKTMLSQVFFAIAVTDQRPMLCGAYFQVTDGRLKIVACDGNRLAVRTTECALGNKNKNSTGLNLSFIVPGKTLSQFMRLMGEEGEEITLLLARKHVIFKQGDNVFFSRLIEGEYIDYNRVIPKETRIDVVLDRSSFIASLERASLVSEDKSLGQGRSHVKFSFESDVLKVSCESLSGSVYDEVPIEKNGEDLLIGFNCRYVLDALRGADSEKIRISMTSALMSVVITSADAPEEAAEGEAKDTGKTVKTDFLYMVCPVRMS